MKEQLERNQIIVRGMAPLLQVFDMPASLKFYRDVLGFSLTESSGEGDDVDWVLLNLNEIELMLNTAYEKEDRPVTPDVLRKVAHSDICLYFGCPDVDGAYAYLKARGVDVGEPEITGYGWKALNLRDPDGYLLCFHWPLQQAK